MSQRIFRSWNSSQSHILRTSFVWKSKISNPLFQLHRIHDCLNKLVNLFFQLVVHVFCKIHIIFLVWSRYISTFLYYFMKICEMYVYNFWKQSVPSFFISIFLNDKKVLINIYISRSWIFSYDHLYEDIKFVST